MEREIPSQSNLETFGALIRDHRLSHGAFRLWHALRDYTDHASKCFPGQRRLAADIGCNLHSLKPWTEELTSAGWLAVSTSGIGEGFTYTVLDGNGRPLRKVATPTVAENRNTPIRSDFNPPRKRMGIRSMPVKRVDQSIPLFSQADFGNFERARIDCWRLTHRATVGAGYAGSQPAPNTRPPPPRPLLGQAGGQNSTFLSPPKPPRKSTCFHANFHCASFCARHGPFQIDSNQRPKNALNR